jgi:site-specific DNA-methyltransferase (adenine-specific)
MNKVIHGDCLEVLKTMADCSVDSVVTDPPYGISFMGKKWDHQVPSVDVWRECLRVLKPGGHMLVACGTRTQHRMVVNIEDAGFEIRDVITWLYGSGFPKSLDVSKAIDKAAGAEGPIIGKNPAFRARQLDHDTDWETAMRPEHKRGPATDAAKQWQGWGTALKPACEFWTLARKPLTGTVAQNVQEHGTGAINVDGCRVDTSDTDLEELNRPNKRPGDGASGFMTSTARQFTPASGRWPANLILDEVAAEMLDEQGGVLKSGAMNAVRSDRLGYHGNGSGAEWDHGPNSGGASRFFYVAKASKAERNAGCEGLPLVKVKFREGVLDENGFHGQTGKPNKPITNQNHHPTVKPIKLMRYLCRLITPPGGTVLDPFTGSGSTGVGAAAEGFDFIGIEREAEYVAIASARYGAATHAANAV